MPYISEIERMGIERGIEVGIEVGKTNTLLRQLRRKLGGLEPTIVERVVALNSEQLDSLTEELLDFQQSQDLLTWLDNLPQNS